MVKTVFHALLMLLLSGVLLRCGGPVPGADATPSAETGGTLPADTVATPGSEPASLPIPLLEDVEPELPYTALLAVPVQVPTGEPAPMKMVIKMVGGHDFTIPSDFAYGFMVTTRDDTPVWWAVHAEGSYRPIVMRTNQNQGNVVSGGTRAYGDVEWDQRDLSCVSSAEAPGECSGAPVPPGTYLVRGLVPIRDGESDTLKASLSGAPEMLGEMGWVATGPHELVIGGPRISCSEEIAADYHLHIEVLRDVKRRHRDWLLAIPGVNGLGVGVMYKHGESTDDLGIVVNVDSRLPVDKVDPENLIPDFIEGCVVSVKAIHFEPATKDNETR